MSFLLRISLIATLGVFTSACSLLEIKLESGIVPLPQEQLNMRVFSRDYSSTFFSTVEQAADKIAVSEPDRKTSGAGGDQVNTQDILLRSNILMWKINAEQTLQRTIFQVAPIAAMVDTWAYTAQMREFFESGAGKSLFGDEQGIAIEASKSLQSRFETIVKGFLTPSEFEKNSKFIQDYVNNNPLVDLSFSRISAFNDWLKFRNINESNAVTTFGSVPEVMTDVADRMAMITEQLPKILSWKAELYALHSNINAEEIQQILTSISHTTARFQELIANSPEMMQTLAVDMRNELSPLLQQLSDSADDKLAQLSTERQALELMVKNERFAIENIITRERIAAAANLDDIAQHTIEVVFAQLTDLLKSLILYFVLFLLVVFFAPLGLGIWLGKRMTIKKESQAS